MSAVDNLEAMMRLEKDLKAQWEKKLTAETYKVEQYAENQAKLEATIAEQVAKIGELVKNTSDLKRMEQENRELGNRAANVKNEYDAQRAKTKTAQKELAEVKSEIKGLKQLDAEKLKKNLVATKNKLQEQRDANELLSKNIKRYKQENSEYLRENESLKTELESLKETELEDEAVTA